MKTKILAVDFDGVLCVDRYPKIGRPRKEVFNYISKQKQKGCKLILWTCRRGKYLDEAVEWCKKQGLYFDAVNENLPESIKKYGGDTRKIFADVYIDDKAIRM